MPQRSNLSRKGLTGLRAYTNAVARLKRRPKTWLITGSAGFIGSNLLETLLRLDQRVVGLDNYSTGSRSNLDQVKGLVGPDQWGNFRQIDGDILDPGTCAQTTRGVDYVLHQAALGSVPRSLANPVECHAANVTGTLNMLIAARDQGSKRFVFASSSAVYGDSPELPKIEEKTGRCLSPYGVSKKVGELYAGVFSQCYGLETICLRYFNVFGPRQDPNGAYAAVIPKWIAAMIRNEPVFINGDGETSRDFCYVANVVQANILAATVDEPAAVNRSYNVAVSGRTSLRQLFELLRKRLAPYYPHLERFQPVHREFRPGDILHSEADVSKAKQLLGYEPSHAVEQGIEEALEWYRGDLTSAGTTSASALGTLGAARPYEYRPVNH